MPRVTVEQIMMTVLTALLTFAVNFLKDMSVSVAKLNVQMSQVIDRIAVSNEKLDDHESRLSNLERRK
jgi:hypothetical protein